MLRTLIHAGLVLGTAVALVACGGAKSDHPSSKHTASTPKRDAGAATAELKIVMQHVGGKDSMGVPAPTGLNCTKSLPATCMANVACPTGNANLGAACSWIAEHGKLLTKETPARQVCTEQYGGPQSVQITGTVDGKPVSRTITRSNGCGIADWQAMSALWSA